MSYVSQSHANRPAAIAGVIGIHAGLGALVVLGLNAEAVVRTFEPNTEATNIPLDPPPAPPPERTEKRKADPTESIIYVPPRHNVLPPEPSFVGTTDVLPPIGDTVILDALPNVGDVGPAITPAFEPKSATPRNSPARWVTDSDYKSRWIREGLSGTARFTLDIAPNGKVESCQITKSTGHAALDQATCALVSKRAKFKPATDDTGQKTAGRYSNAIRWQLPD